jgi:hypothetical protein
MTKLTLSVDDLHVDSFDPDASASASCGTVRAHQATQSRIECGFTQAVTCGFTCSTCVAEECGLTNEADCGGETSLLHPCEATDALCI